MFELSAKLKTNNSRTFPSKKTTFWVKGGANIFGELPVFGQRWNHRSQCDMPALGNFAAHSVEVANFEVENINFFCISLPYFASCIFSFIAKLFIFTSDQAKFSLVTKSPSSIVVVSFSLQWIPNEYSSRVMDGLCRPWLSFENFTTNFWVC